MRTPPRYRRAGDALLETGVTAYLPTLITSPEEQVLAAMREVPVDDAARPRILGMHLEGPFLSPNRLGTHEASSRRDPDLPLLERLLDAGPVRLMTLAPELAGAGALIDVLLARGVVVSLGHTDATVAQANAAFDAGARGVTHLFNAMRPLLHRDPGIVGAALARDDVYVSVIIDGIHLAPETARTVWKAARERTVLVSDAIAAAPRNDGPSTLGELDLQVHEGAVRGPDGVLAGSVLTMIEAVRNLHAAGRPDRGRGGRGDARSRRAARRPGARAHRRRATRRPRRAERPHRDRARGRRGRRSRLRLTGLRRPAHRAPPPRRRAARRGTSPRSRRAPRSART